jgi:type IV pilus assembly protein PilQ
MSIKIIKKPRRWVWRESVGMGAHFVFLLSGALAAEMAPMTRPQPSPNLSTAAPQFATLSASFPLAIPTVSFKSNFEGAPITLNFQNIDVRSALKVLADFTHLNLVVSDSVKGSLTLRLKEVPWDQALQIILEAKGLTQHVQGNVIWIGPISEVEGRIKREWETAQWQERLEPLVTESYQLNYAHAIDLAGQLRGSPSVGSFPAGGGGGAGLGGGGGGIGGGGGGGFAGGGGSSAKFLSSRGVVMAEPRTNQLFVTDTPQRQVAVAALIKKLDVALRQVLIEAKIVEANASFGSSLGVRLGGGALLGSKGGTQVGLGSSATPAVPLASTSTFISLPAVGQGGYPPASLGVSIFKAGTSQILNLEISALEADGQGHVLSSPRVVTADQTKAVIEQGTEIPYQQATASGATSVSFRKAVLSLEVTPQITPDGKVILELDVNKDSPSTTTAAGITIDTKHVRTQVLVENGGTVVIGGIYSTNEVLSQTQVPLLGDVPVLGALFRTKTKTQSKQELLIFISPRVIVEAAGTVEAAD